MNRQQRRAKTPQKKIKISDFTGRELSELQTNSLMKITKAIRVNNKRILLLVILLSITLALLIFLAIVQFRTL